jgi:hypothetical protein
MHAYYGQILLYIYRHIVYKLAHACVLYGQYQLWTVSLSFSLVVFKYKNARPRSVEIYIGLLHQNTLTQCSFHKKIVRINDLVNFVMEFAVDFSYPGVKRGKTLNAISHGTIFSHNSQCKWCFYKMYWLANDLLCLVGH